MIVLKTFEEIEKMRIPNSIAGRCLAFIESLVVPGITTAELDRAAEKFILDNGGTCAFKGYRGYPASLCVSVNNQVVHGIPGKRKLLAGDIVSVDVGVKAEGFYGDCALTASVGKIKAEDARLIDVTKKSLDTGIKKAVVGNRLFDISYAIQTYVEENGFSVVRQFVGHGIGKELHEEPQIPNFGQPNRGVRLELGMTLAIEPMVNLGKWRVEVEGDGWTAVTADGTNSAHFEHTIVITNNGPEILTKG